MTCFNNRSFFCVQEIPYCKDSCLTPENCLSEAAFDSASRLFVLSFLDKWKIIPTSTHAYMTVLISRATDQSNFNFEIGATLNYIEIANLFVLNIKKLMSLKTWTNTMNYQQFAYKFQSHVFIFSKQWSSKYFFSTTNLNQIRMKIVTWS